MHALETMLVLTTLAGLAMPLGAVLANSFNVKREWLASEIRHSIIAFAAGALLSAVALVLVPKGIEHLSTLWMSVAFISGSLCFMFLDMLFYKYKTPASQLAAMLVDFIPESLALGAIFSIGGEHALLLAILIGLQNFPEGFNAFSELHERGNYSSKKVILLFVLLALLGPVAGITGYTYLSELPEVLAGIMLFAAGGILYSVFQDIAPNIKLESRWLPPMGAVLGFVLGLIGHQLTG